MAVLVPQGQDAVTSREIRINIAGGTASVGAQLFARGILPSRSRTPASCSTSARPSRRACAYVRTGIAAGGRRAVACRCAHPASTAYPSL